MSKTLHARIWRSDRNKKIHGNVKKTVSLDTGNISYVSIKCDQWFSVFSHYERSYYTF